MHSFIGLFQKKANTGIEVIEFKGLLKKLQRNFQGLIKNKMEFPEVIKKMEFPGVLVLGLKISMGFESNLKNDFLGNFY